MEGASTIGARLNVASDGAEKFDVCRDTPKIPFDLSNILPKPVEAGDKGLVIPASHGV